MDLSTKLLKEFVNAVVYTPPKETESHCYGTMVNATTVLFDGADEPTPCEALVSVSPEDRVVITIRDNNCYVTGVL
jgi:hypothetical protein